MIRFTVITSFCAALAAHAASLDYYQFHRQAHQVIPMGIAAASYGSNMFTYPSILKMAGYLNANGLVAHGYNVVLLNCGDLSYNRDANGNIQMGPTGSEINVTNLVHDLLTK
jgi:hypothetical protein